MAEFLQSKSTEDAELNGKPKKKLHLVVMAVLVVFVVCAALYNNLSKKDKAQKEETPDASTTQQSVENFGTRLRDQAESSVGEAEALDPNTLFPTEDSLQKRSAKLPSGAGDIAVDQSIAQDTSEIELEKERLRQQALTSKTSAYTRASIGRTLPTGMPGIPDMPQPTEGFQMSDEDRALLASMAPKAAEPKALSQREADQEWYEQNRDRAEGLPPTISNVYRASKHTIFQGTVIPAITVTATRSDMPGPIKAMVRENVYDGIDGKSVLIPKGSTIYGQYNNNVAIGQKMIQFAFTRIILPNGQSLDIGGMPGADAYGQNGLKDRVDTHFWEIFGSSFIIASVGAIVDNMNSRRNNTVIVGGSSTGSAVGGAAGQVLADTSRVILQRNINIQPTILIGQGLKFNLQVTRDISIPVYRDVRP